MEADSLNCIVLGDDVTQHAEWDDEKEVRKEMTVKAGQKCTAIRRILFLKIKWRMFGKLLVNPCSKLPLAIL
jgi:oxepin-CoA hydrolase/3-oxo-5,6-dehydrosuberyl-CoA semialdehyde dehydrogenase